MLPSREAMRADEDETTPLVRVAQAAPEADAPPAAASRDVMVIRARQEEYMKRLERVLRLAPRLPWWRRLPFLGPTNEYKRLGHFERLALDRQCAVKCLEFYNSSHPDQYEPAPGELTEHLHLSYVQDICWFHGNFVARQKPSAGWLSFLLSFLLPAPRTLFFFEIRSTRERLREVITCTPLDEPVTEAYSFLGFPLGRSKRRSGQFDTICRTCSHRFYRPHPGIQSKPRCSHHNARKVCGMCYKYSVVLHPDEFKFGVPDLSDPTATVEY